MKKRLIAVLLCLCLTASLLVVALPAGAAPSNPTLVITADKSEAPPGDTVNFYVTLGPVSEMGRYLFRLDIPAGLTFVPGSGQLSVTKEELGAKTLDFSEGSLTFDGFSPDVDYQSNSDTELMTFQCTVNDDATGTLSVGLKELQFFSGQGDMEEWESSVTVTPAEVTVKTEAATEAPAPATEAAPTEEPTAGTDDDPAGLGLSSDDVDVTVNYGKGYGNYSSYGDCYTGIDSIVVKFPAGGISADKLKAAFVKDLDSDAEYDDINWIQDDSDEKVREAVQVNPGEPGENTEISLSVVKYVKAKYDSEFSDGDADGTYTFVFPYDSDDEKKPVLYRRQFTIDNTAPEFTACSLSDSDWTSSDVDINYTAEDDGAGVDYVRLYQDVNGSRRKRQSKYESDSSFTVSEKGTYYLTATDNLGNASEYKLAGEVKIDKAKPEFGEEIDYGDYAPGAEKWTSSPVDVTFTVKKLDSKLKEVKVDDASVPFTENEDGTYSVTVKFEDNKNKTVVATSKTNVSSKPMTLYAPQIDTKLPDKDSIRNIGVSRADGSDTLLNLLTFGALDKRLYDNQEIILTVFATDSGSPITSIDVTDSKVKKIEGGYQYDSESKIASQSFRLPVGESAADSDYSAIAFTLTDKAGNSTAKSITLAEIATLTVDAEGTPEFAGAQLKEMITTKIAPDIKSVTVDADKKSGDVFRDNIVITADLEEPLTGLKKVEVYFDTIDKFNADNKFAPNGAKKVTSDITLTTPIASDSKTVSTSAVYHVNNDAPTGRYVFYVTAYNNSGNSLSQYQILTIDKTEPQIEVAPLSSDWTNDNNTKVELSVTDTIEGVDGCGIEKVTLKSTLNGVSSEKELTPGEDGKYSFTPKSGEDYEIKAVDAFGNSTEAAGTSITLKHGDIKFDTQPPTIGEFTYSNDDGGKKNEKWMPSVTVSFTADDLYEGTTLSGVNTDSFVITKAGTSDELDLTKPEIAFKAVADGDKYNCSFVVHDNYTAYTVTVRDKAGEGNISAPATTEVIKRDDTGPEVEKIVFTNVITDKKFGVYGGKDGKAIEAVVYMKSGCAAPVTKIQLKNGTNDLDAVKDQIDEVKEGEKTLYKKAFYIPLSDTSTCANLGVYAESAAGIKITKNADENGVVNIASINVFANENPIAKEPEFFEAVSKASGPSVTIDTLHFPKDESGVKGYIRNNAGKPTSYADFAYNVTDAIAGVSEDTVKMYFDTADKFEADGTPKAGAKELTISKNFTKDTANNIDKVIGADGTYAETEADNASTLASGRYVLSVVAENLAGTPKVASETFYIDNTAPEISIVSYNGLNDADTWKQGDAEVTFTVTDMPNTDGQNGGVDDATVKVTGVLDGKDYPVTHVSGNTYSFTTRVSQNYRINAKDVFGSKAQTVTTEKRVKVDNEAPHITVPKLSEYQTQWSADTKTIEFKVEDIADSDDYKKNGTPFAEADRKLSGVHTVTVKDKDGNLYEVTPSAIEQTADQKTYSFVADKYDDYIITVTDSSQDEYNKENEATFTVSRVKVDTIAPEITKVSFKEQEPDAVGKILNFLTFGIYAKQSVLMTVEGTDAFASSGIQGVRVIATDTQNHTEFKIEKTTKNEISNADPDLVDIYDAAAVAAAPSSTVKTIFKLDEAMFSDYDNITVEIIDNTYNTKDEGTASNVNHTTGKQSLSAIKAAGNIEYPDGFTVNKDNFEVVISNKAPKISGIQPRSNDAATTKEFVDGNKYWYSNENFSVDFNVHDEISKLHAIQVKINDDDSNIITQCYEKDTTNTLPEQFTDFVAATDISTRDDQEVNDKNVTINVEQLSQGDKDKLYFIKDSDKVNVFHISAQGNNGVVSEDVTPEICIDTVGPEITKFEFSGDGVSELNEDGSETKEIADAVDAIDGVTSDNYVYFFKDETRVKITATDTHSGIAGSGVKTIHFITVGKSTPDGSIETSAEQTLAVDGDNTATFTVSAGFKGSIYAYATDMVENDGKYYNPHNLVVEDSDTHSGSSSTRIEIADTNEVATDNNGHRLFNGDATVTLTIEDRFSGIKTVDYSFDGIEDSAHYSGTVTVGIDGSISDTGGGTWTVEEQEHNLIQRISRVITVDAFGDFNSNDIEIKVSGYDRSGYEIAESTETISVDTTAPTIEVTYDPTAGSGNTYSTDEYEYFKVTRTMTVTVYERNFNPDNFDYTGIVNNYVSGDVPALSAGTDWSTDYAEYRDTTAHTCSFTFANDGDYEIKLDCTDEAQNKAETYTGEKFTIDTIDPTVEVSLNGTAKNGKYYNETVTATITVNEHNFAEGDTYVTFTPKTDFDTSYGNSGSTPAISGWSSSGDTHTTTVEFSSDGIFSFTFDYKDKALREAQQFSQSEFVIDKSFDKMIKFIDVTESTAYDGEIAPKVSFDDTNLDTASTTLTRISLNTTDLSQTTETPNLDHGFDTNSGSSRTDSYSNFPAEVENDGIYELEATGSDLAGNTQTEKILFSVNRYGSTFMLTKESDEWVGKGYVNTADLLGVIEINVNEVTDQSVSVSHNSQTQKLTKKSNYDFTSQGDTENWYRYDYSIYKDNFSQEGNYTVTVSSTDTFNKNVSNRTAYVDEEKSIVKNCPISFVVDQTEPKILIEGVESNTPYGDPEKTVQIVCTDTNIDPASLEIRDENDKVLKEGADYQLDALAGELDIEMVIDDPGKHTLSVHVGDFAKNTSEDAVTDFELNASIFTLFFHNTTAVICTAVALAALVGLAILLILKKRKREAPEGGPSGTTGQLIRTKSGQLVKAPSGSLKAKSGDLKGKSGDLKGKSGNLKGKSTDLKGKSGNLKK